MDIVVKAILLNIEKIVLFEKYQIFAFKAGSSRNILVQKCQFWFWRERY